MSSGAGPSSLSLQDRLTGAGNLHLFLSIRIAEKREQAVSFSGESRVESEPALGYRGPALKSWSGSSSAMVEALFNLKAASRTAEITHECGPGHTRVLIIDEGLSRVSFAIGDGAHARL